MIMPLKLKMPFHNLRRESTVNCHSNVNYEYILQELSALQIPMSADLRRRKQDDDLRHKYGLTKRTVEIPK